ncbi:unnamed protein product [Mytilus edulis]|uniref:Uncharacterized protein n=1 Tax=Mytilus edulis TaxID=6550 RepID=A0A8S3TSY2_MYTED|nr:unnamed protein product [Mytilus edulis]
MANIQRTLSVHFYTRGFKGITHDEIIKELEKQIKLESVKSIQLTEKSCVVTLSDIDAKERLVQCDLTIKNRTVKFIEKKCLKDEVLTYIDVDNIFIKNGNVVKALYEKTDASGVHITIEGAQTIRVKLREFLHPKMSPIQNTPRPCDTKRKLSDISLTPMSAEKDNKQSRPGSFDEHE